MAMGSDSKRRYSEDDQVPTVMKRKYRKHPKPDPNAPKKPSPSAYHLFALNQGEKLRKSGYGFEDIARETGAMWRALSPQAVNNLESKTTQAKNQYRKDLASYKKSAEYRSYQEYLKRWMAKEEMKKQQQSNHERKQSIASSISQPSPPPTEPTLSPTSSITADMPLLDMSTSSGSSQLSDADLFMDMSDCWVPMPELSTAEQLEWKWSADFGVTLAPDPLFPLQSAKTDMFSTTMTPMAPMAPMVPMSSTISPIMLSQPFSYQF